MILGNIVVWRYLVSFMKMFFFGSKFYSRNLRNPTFGSTFYAATRKHYLENFSAILPINPANISQNISSTVSEISQVFGAPDPTPIPP